MRQHGAAMSFRSLSLACLIWLFIPLFAHGGEKPWVEVRSPNFRVLSDGSDKDARRVAREFEQMRAVFADNFPNFRLDSGAPLLVLAARDENSAKTLAPQLWKQKGAKLAGYFQHGWEKQFAIVRLDAIAPGAYQVVYHEYTHTLLHLNFRWMPLWMDEGLAEFYGNTRFEQDRMFLGAPTSRFSSLLEKPLIRLETLLAVNQISPYYHDEDKVQMFYAESWALIHFLMFDPGMEQGKRLNQFQSLLLQGTDQKKAFAQVFGDPAELDKKLDQYVHRFTMTAIVVKNPPQIREKDFAARPLTTAETDAELGGYHLWAHDLANARPLVEQALRDDPKLSTAHENMGFLHFTDGKDEDAAREFSQAYDLDGSRYLSLFFKTMLSAAARSETPADQTSLRDALLQTLKLNPQFAPAYVQLARLYVRQGKLTEALAVARKAEQLEPSRAGYHLLCGQIMLRLGRGADAAVFAKYVADRWYGPDHDEAVALWNSVPAEQRPAGDPPSETALKETQTVEGRVQSANCGDKDHFGLTLQRGNESLTFRSKGAWMSGFSDTVWYGADHFSLCHHVEGMRAILRFKPPSDNSYAGDLAEVELREDLPAPPVAEKVEESKPVKKQ